MLSYIDKKNVQMLESHALRNTKEKAQHEKVGRGLTTAPQ
jgi:hypothetical protein